MFKSQAKARRLKPAATHTKASRAKKILALRGKANVGKSKAIKSVYKLLISKYPRATQEYLSIGADADVRAVVTINGVKIGIESQGDPNSRLFKSLKLFAKLQCHVIVCATRTRGATVKAVESQKSDYEVIWYEQSIVKGEEVQNQNNINMAKTILLETEKFINA